MKLRAKVLPKYFRKKKVEFRQFESITLINTETNEEIEFDIIDVEKLPPESAEFIMKRHSDIPWNTDKPIYAISLGDSINDKAR